jgi:hypothetical protein
MFRKARKYGLFWRCAGRLDIQPTYRRCSGNEEPAKLADRMAQRGRRALVSLRPLPVPLNCPKPL